MGDNLVDFKLIQELVSGAGQNDIKTLWAKTLSALTDIVSATGISLSTLTANGPLHLRIGTLSPEATSYVAQWESRFPREEEPLLVDTAHQTEHFAVLHISLDRADGLYGSLSIVFENGSDLGPELQEKLTQEVRVLAGILNLIEEFQLASRRLQQISLYYQIGQDITSTLDHFKVLEKTTALAQQVLEADASTLFLIDSEREELVFTIPYGEKEGMLREMRMPMGQGVVGWVATQREPVIINDVSQDPRFAAAVDAQTGFTTRSILCVPLQYHGRTMGVLEVLNKRGDKGFTAEDQEWLMALAAQAAIAIENARMVKDLQVESEYIIETQEQVRNQLARDLHDGPAQVLLAMIQNINVARYKLQKNPLSVAQELDLLDELAREAHRQMRQHLFELRPIILEHRGLVAAIETFLEQQTKIWSYKVHFETNVQPEHMDSKGASAVFMIVQEALNNARKHAKAKEVHLRLYEHGSQLRFEIEDDGIGLNVTDYSSSDRTEMHYGLINMRERARLLGGELHILSPRPQGKPGTLVTGWVPLHRLHPQREEFSRNSKENGVRVRSASVKML